MRIETTRFEITTDEGVSIADLTSDVNTFVASTGILDGLGVMMVGRQECFLSMAPDLDDAFDDLLRLVRQARGLSASVRPEATSDRADTEATPQAPPGFLAESLSFAVRGGSADIGNWDAIVLVDAGGPARRAVELTVMGIR